MWPAAESHMSTWKFTANCLFDCTSVIKSSGSHKRVLSTGVEQLCAPLSAKLIYLCRPALQRPNWATRYDCHDAPCAKTWAKRRVFSFMEAMSSYGSWLWLICKASSIMRRFFFFWYFVLCLICAVLFAGAGHGTTINEKWPKVSKVCQCFIANR